MDEDIAIIDANTRSEKIKNFYLNNKKKIFSLILVIIFLTFGYFFFQDLKKKEKIELADKFYSASIKFIEGDRKNIENNFIDIVKSKDKTYSPLALFFLIDNKIISSNEKINELFDIIINDSGLDKETKKLIIYKKGLFNSDFETENNLLNILNPVINSESIWKSHALYLLAEFFYSKKELEKSKEFFMQILDLENANSNIKLQAQKRINRDFSE